MPERPLTFSERHGHVPLPQQLKTDELSQELRARLWNIVYRFLELDAPYRGTCFWLGGNGEQFARRWHVEGLHRPIDEFDQVLSQVTDPLKKLFFAARIYPLFDFLEFTLASPHFPEARKQGIAASFEACKAAWRVSNGLLVPVASDAEAEAVTIALREVEAAGNAGTNTHLRKSIEALSSGRWADSARESIHAIEGAARAVDEKKTLGEVVRSLRTHGKPIHPALAKSLLAFYGYGSDEKGIRHSPVDEAEAAVGEREALLIFGMSAAFASYLAASISRAP